MTGLTEALRRASCRLLQTVDLGTTARIHVVERDGRRYALKAARDEGAGPSALLTEYRVLRYLDATPMQRYVPSAGDWLPEVGGFLMATLRYPTPAEKDDPAWVPTLARALRTLHSAAPPAIPGLPDDRPDVARSVARRFAQRFEAIRRPGAFWAGLSPADRPWLAHVRARYEAYAGLLPQLAQGLADAPVALTHGDLAGDNLMVTPEGQLALVDWGAARISAAWVDVASLATYSEWPPEGRRQFYRCYLGERAGSAEEAQPCLERLSRLHRYRACVQSLLWLNDEGQGLDAVGRAFFERQVAAL